MLSVTSGWRGLGFYLAAVGVLTLAVELPVYRAIGWLPSASISLASEKVSLRVGRSA
jgi:hypothetical protein